MRASWLLLLAWFALSHLGIEGEPDDTDKDAIRDLMVRHYIKNIIKLKLTNLVMFVEFDKGADPNDSFLARLADLKIRIRKRSRLKFVDSGPASEQSVFDRETNEPGVLIAVRNPELTGDRKGEVDGRIMKAGLWGYGGTFQIEKAKGGWKIIK